MTVADWRSRARLRGATVVPPPRERIVRREGSAASPMKDSCELLMFEIAKGGFAESGKEIGDGEAGVLLDAMIEIDGAAAKLASEQPGSSRFSAAHESIEAQK